jgi:hypothetical protein
MTLRQCCLQQSFMNLNPAGFSSFTVSIPWEEVSPHCHMDGYQSGAGLGLYNDSDYVGKTHPPLIGFGYDGIALFGKYRGSIDSSLLGYSTSLDSFGGHEHDGIGYHYHAHTVSNHVPSGQSYSTDMNVLMKGAYIGKITSVPNFRSRESKFNNDRYLGGTVIP